ncbi:hypothetical protein [Paenibacillus fonticola]|uniref:hypothetical protein n=1 Tax=Paenibacillus fonticola TaxID=379896 RepID=UPI00036AACFB|nr:hypothetical protein [Paenibacillus fonticola]
MNRRTLYSAVVLLVVGCIVMALVPLPQDEYDRYFFPTDHSRTIELRFEQIDVIVEEADGSEDQIEVHVLRGRFDSDIGPQANADGSVIHMDVSKTRSERKPFFYQIRSWIPLYQFDKYRDHARYESYLDNAEVRIIAPSGTKLAVSANSVHVNGTTLSVKARLDMTN